MSVTQTLEKTFSRGLTVTVSPLLFLMAHNNNEMPENVEINLAILHY